MAFRYVKSEYLNESLPAGKGARSLKFQINISKKVNREHKESREEEMENVRNRNKKKKKKKMIMMMMMSMKKDVQERKEQDAKTN